MNDEKIIDDNYLRLTQSLGAVILDLIKIIYEKNK